MSEKFYIETFGCQMNKSDSEAMTLSLTENGFQQAISVADADITIFNTCSVREHAESRALSRLNAVKHEIRRKEGITVIAGCMAQRIGEELVQKGTADIVVGPYESPGIGKIVKQYLKNREPIIALSQNIEDFGKRIGRDLISIKRDFHWHKWLTITHGCENYCSYCIVPYVRGKLVSFPSDEIIEYARDMAAAGITEVTLLGQNVNQYGTDSGDITFARLLEKVASIKGFHRINFITSHPKDFTDDIISVIRDNPVISRALHLPMQSGSDTVLKAMNRQYTMKHYYGLIEAIDSALDDYSLSTDIIVGFPGEKPEDFKETLEAVKKIRFDNAFMYAYSSREGTPASSLKESLTREEKIIRLQELIELQRSISREKLENRVSRIEQAIVERISKKSGSQVMGKTFLDHPVVMPGSADDIGKKVSVQVESVSGSALQGRIIDNPAN